MAEWPSSPSPVNSSSAIDASSDAVLVILVGRKAFRFRALLAAYRAAASDRADQYAAYRRRRQAAHLASVGRELLIAAVALMPPPPLDYVYEAPAWR